MQEGNQERKGKEDKSLNDLDSLASGPFSKIEKQCRRPGESDQELTEVVRRLLRDLDNLKEGTQEQEERDAGDQAVFRQAYIPQTLNEVLDPERDIEKRNQGGKEDLIYKNVIGVDEREGVVAENEETTSEGSSESGSERGSNEEAAADKKERAPRGHRHEDRDAKKERKKEVKEAARERRKTKMPKSEKKRRMRASHK